MTRESAPASGDLTNFNFCAAGVRTQRLLPHNNKSAVMASNGSESPSKNKRSRAEMEADEVMKDPTVQTNDGMSHASSTRRVTDMSR